MCDSQHVVNGWVTGRRRWFVWFLEPLVWKLFFRDFFFLFVKIGLFSSRFLLISWAPPSWVKTRATDSRSGDEGRLLEVANTRQWLIRTIYEARSSEIRKKNHFLTLPPRSIPEKSAKKASDQQLGLALSFIDSQFRAKKPTNPVTVTLTACKAANLSFVMLPSSVVSLVYVEAVAWCFKKSLFSLSRWTFFFLFARIFRDFWKRKNFPILRFHQITHFSQ